VKNLLEAPGALRDFRAIKRDPATRTRGRVASGNEADGPGWTKDGRDSGSGTTIGGNVQENARAFGKGGSITVTHLRGV